MKSRSVFFTAALALVMSLMVSSVSADPIWRPRTGGRLWADAVNWQDSIAPEEGSNVFIQSSGGAGTVPDPNTGEEMPFPGGRDWAPVITSAVSFTDSNPLNQVNVGVWGSGPDIPTYVIMEGGSIVTADRIAVGNDSGYTAVWEQSGGYTKASNNGFFIGYEANSRGEVYISGGEIHAPGDGLRFNSDSGLLEISGDAVVYAERIQGFETTQDEIISIKDNGKLYLVGESNPSAGGLWTDWVRSYADAGSIIGYDGTGGTILAQYNSETGYTEVWTDDPPAVPTSYWRPLTQNGLWATTGNWDDGHKPTQGTNVFFQSSGGPYTVPDPDNPGERIPYPGGRDWGATINGNINFTESKPLGQINIGAWGNGPDVPSYVIMEGGSIVTSSRISVGGYAGGYTAVWEQSGGYTKSGDGFFIGYDPGTRGEVYLSGGEIHAPGDGLRFHSDSGLLEISGDGAFYADRIQSFAVTDDEDEIISISGNGRLYLTGQSNPAEPYTWADWIHMYADYDLIVGEDGTGDSIEAYYDPTLDKTIVLSVVRGGAIDVTDIPGVVPDDGIDDYAGLQFAVDVYDDIYLPAGTYNLSQTIYLRSGCFIHGDSYDDTILTLDTDTDCFRIDGQDNVKIKDMKLVRPPQPEASMNEMIFGYNNSSNVVVDSVKVTGSRARADTILFHTTSSCSVINSVIYDYQVQLMWPEGDVEGNPEVLQTYGSGISFLYSDGVVVQNNYIEETTDLTIPDTTYKPYYQAAGIQVSACTSGVIADNRIKVSGNGIDTSSSQHLTVDHNYIYNMNQAGIKVVNGASYIDITNNHLKRCELVGIWLTPGAWHRGTNHNLVDNNILGYTGYGLHPEGFWDGWFGGTVPAGIHLDSEDSDPLGQSTSNTVSNNRFYNNDRMTGGSIVIRPGTYPAVDTTLLNNTLETGDPEDYVLSNDVNADNVVDIYDLLEIADTWLKPCGPGVLNTDIIVDGTVDLLDFGEFTGGWIY